MRKTSIVGALAMSAMAFIDTPKKPQKTISKQKRNKVKRRIENASRRKNMLITNYFRKFFQIAQSSGNLLIICVIVSLMIANSSLGDDFQNLLNYPIRPYSTSLWINDGLMAIFFLLVGLEIKRELIEGELSSLKNASLPIFAAIGGMLVPALIFVFFNYGTKYQNGWGIPMATDIAFSLAIISMLGKRVPASVKIFLTALAIVDDIGASIS